MKKILVDNIKPRTIYRDFFGRIEIMLGLCDEAEQYNDVPFKMRKENNRINIEKIWPKTIVAYNLKCDSFVYYAADAVIELSIDVIGRIREDGTFEGVCDDAE